jgi:hypothetical protein
MRYHDEIRFMTPPREASKAGGDAPRLGRRVMSGSTASLASAEVVANFGPDEEMVAGTMQRRFEFAWIIGTDAIDGRDILVRD